MHRRWQMMHSLRPTMVFASRLVAFLDEIIAEMQD